MAPPRGHEDLGLQPERTLLAWRRTLLSLVGASVLFLRWVPHHGALAVSLVLLALLAAGGIWLGQGHRYRVSVAGISADRTPPPLLPVLALGLAACTLGGLGVFVVLVLG
ncbi:DUF202 domain-containing protein [Pseudomonas sp. NPDC007930]|uniref:DUF202 domain-containing protein n=1 Tax=Pseudomonas sp. NPDC007930 TaxID=3364417 RepID=UPI0036ED1682